MESPTKKINLGNDFFAIVDADYQKVLEKFSWRAVKAHCNYYAKATINSGGKKLDISMHRFVAHTPRHFVCHHINHDSLDNRRENLVNMTKQEHAAYHSLNNITIKRDRNWSILTPEKLTTPTETNTPPPP
jgi:hypothetical protein